MKGRYKEKTSFIDLAVAYLECFGFEGHIIAKVLHQPVQPVRRRVIAGPAERAGAEVDLLAEVLLHQQIKLFDILPRPV